MTTLGRSVPPPVEHRVIDIETPHGMARVYVLGDSCPHKGTLVLGHGAGKGTNTPDLHGLLDMVVDGWRVLLVDQPWVVAGRKLATRPPTLDDAWIAVVEHLRAAGEVQEPLVVGGRSAGARVACRTAAQLGAHLVLALAFPLMPPGKQDQPAKWRTSEAQSVIDAGIPLVVVQGRTDAFGGPGDIEAVVPDARVIPVVGPHGFTKQPDDVLAAVRLAVSEIR